VWKNSRKNEFHDFNKTGPFSSSAIIYLRVSTVEQTTANQERELREIASRMGCEIVKVYRDHGISGAKGRDKRPAFDKLCRDAARREFDMVMEFGRSVALRTAAGSRLANQMRY
jgi:Resolvase, N terminal domain